MRLFWSVAALAALGAACPRAPEVPPPDGAALYATGDATRALLAAAAQVEGSQLALRARAQGEALKGCQLVAGQGPSFAELLEALACAEEAPAWVESARALAPGQGILLALGDSEGRLIADVEVQGASLTVVARFRERPTRGPATLFVPADDSAGPAVLSAKGALIHGRLRVNGGIDIAAMTPKDSQAAELFGLQAELLSSAVLAGTWEVALYAPDEKRRVLPPIAVALGVRSRAAAERALEGFLEQLRQQWPVQPTQATVAGRPATCLPNVRILPELSPCAVILDDAVVIGWNPDALAFALDAAGAATPLDGARVALAELPAADERLARARPAKALAVQLPWSSLVVEPLRDEGAPGFRIVLPAREAR